jgi:hypothetical protein
MSKDSNITGDGKDVKQPRTQVADLATVGHALSQDELDIVAGGVTAGRKMPADDDATYVSGNVRFHLD